MYIWCIYLLTLILDPAKSGQRLPKVAKSCQKTPKITKRCKGLTKVAKSCIWTWGQDNIWKDPRALAIRISYGLKSQLILPGSVWILIEGGVAFWGKKDKRTSLVQELVVTFDLRIISFLINGHFWPYVGISHVLILVCYLMPEQPAPLSCQPPPKSAAQKAIAPPGGAQERLPVRAALQKLPIAWMESSITSTHMPHILNTLQAIISLVKP